jgi:hypothetical protein
MLLVEKTTACREPRELSLDEVEDELASWAAHLSAGMCRWLELVAELDRRGGWAESGVGSCAEWLAWRWARGQPIAPAPRPELGSAGALLEHNQDLAIPARTCKCGDGDPLDLDLAVAALSQIAATRRYKCYAAMDESGHHSA